MKSTVQSPRTLAAEIGRRLRQVRLNANLTQQELAQQAGVSRNAVVGAESGKVHLETLLALMAALQLTAQLDAFLAPPELSPLALVRLQGKARRRASGATRRSSVTSAPDGGDSPW